MVGLGTHTFRTRLVIATAVTVFFVQLLGASVDIYTGYTRLSAEMDVKGRLVVEQTSAAISRPVWDFDDILVEEILESLFGVSDVARVAIVSITGETEVELLADALSEPGALRLYSEPIIIYEGASAETLGVLDVTISTSGLKAELWALAIQKSILVLTILGLASPALYLVLGRLSKPLEDLRNAVRAIEHKEYDLPVPGRDRYDEIGALANALDGLREREAELAVLRRANSEKVIREGKRIQQALHSTRDVVVLVDETDKIIFRNASAKTFFPEFSIGDTLVERRGEKRSRADQVRSALLSRSEIDTEISIVLHGAARHFQARTGPIVDYYGNDLGGLFLASDFTEQFEHSKEASYLASHDPLTGLLNRRQMDVALAEWTEGTDQHVGMLLVDLDHFKEINDTLGHQLGDSLLVEIARLLCELSTPDDLVIRLGGDEFAVVTQGQNSEHHLDVMASTAIDKLQKPLLINGRSVQISISAGIAISATAKTGWSSETLMRHADFALYEAKNGGRGRYEIYKNELSEVYDRRRKMEVSFRTALETDCVFPVYQVQTSIHDGSVVGFEALARWMDPDLGLISPTEFILLAENADLIEPLTRKIMINACETAVEWREHGFHHRIAVNLSPKLFDGTVLGLVKDCLKITGCPSEMIELEITESVLLSNSNVVKKEIEDLRALGLSIALDDFGIGYSSLDYLRRFPVDKIKIDRAFVRDIAKSEQSRAIITAISQLGHSLGMKVTGEGAETSEDRLALANCGVDVVQGFVDGLPTTKSEAEQIFITGSVPRIAAG